MNEKKTPPQLIALPQRDQRMSIRRDIASQEEILARQELVFSLRVDKGLTLRQISDQVGVAVSTVHEDLKTVAKMKYQGLIEKDELILLEQNAYYDSLLSRWLPLAMDDRLDIGEVRQNARGEDYEIQLEAWKASSEATSQVLKILEGKAKINGLTAQRSEKSNSPTGEGDSIALKMLEMFQKQMPAPRPIHAEVIELE